MNLETINICDSILKEIEQTQFENTSENFNKVHTSLVSLNQSVDLSTTDISTQFITSNIFKDVTSETLGKANVRLSQLKLSIIALKNVLINN